MEKGIDLTIMKGSCVVNVTMDKRVGVKINIKINYVNNEMIRTSNHC